MQMSNTYLTMVAKRDKRDARKAAERASKRGAAAKARDAAMAAFARMTAVHAVASDWADVAQGRLDAAMPYRVGTADIGTGACDIEAWGRPHCPHYYEYRWCGCQAQAHPYLAKVKADYARMNAAAIRTQHAARRRRDDAAEAHLAWAVLEEPNDRAHRARRLASGMSVRDVANFLAFGVCHADRTSPKWARDAAKEAGDNVAAIRADRAAWKGGDVLEEEAARPTAILAGRKECWEEGLYDVVREALNGHGYNYAGPHRARGIYVAVGNPDARSVTYGGFGRYRTTWRIVVKASWMDDVFNVCYGVHKGCFVLGIVAGTALVVYQRKNQNQFRTKWVLLTPATGTGDAT